MAGGRPARNLAAAFVGADRNVLMKQFVGVAEVAT